MKDKRVEFQKELKEEAKDHLNKVCDQLENGRHYLMSVDPKKLTVEDALEAFGFGRNGLKINS